MNTFSEKIFNIKSEEEFEKNCMQLFEFQMDNNPIYSTYSEIILKGETPKNSN